VLLSIANDSAESPVQHDSILARLWKQHIDAFEDTQLRRVIHPRALAGAAVRSCCRPTGWRHSVGFPPG
jgi:hypothetical protein